MTPAKLSRLAAYLVIPIIHGVVTGLLAHFMGLKPGQSLLVGVAVALAYEFAGWLDLQREPCIDDAQQPLVAKLFLTRELAAFGLPTFFVVLWLGIAMLVDATPSVFQVAYAYGIGLFVGRASIEQAYFQRPKESQAQALPPHLERREVYRASMYQREEWWS